MYFDCFTKATGTKLSNRRDRYIKIYKRGRLQFGRSATCNHVCKWGRRVVVCVRAGTGRDGRSKCVTVDIAAVSHADRTMCTRDRPRAGNLYRKRREGRETSGYARSYQPWLLRAAISVFSFPLPNLPVNIYRGNFRKKCSEAKIGGENVPRTLSFAR